MNPHTVFTALFMLMLCFNPTAMAKSGEQLSQQCIGCHGVKGNSQMPSRPTLAGQQESYLKNQLYAFAKGTRNNVMMQNIAKNLSDDDIKQLAQFFSQQKTKSAGGDAKLKDTGRKLSSMCLGCHGNNAQGRGQFPRLAGQHATYLTKQLQNFKQGKRQGGPMPSIAKGLSNQDIKALAAYFASL